MRKSVGLWSADYSQLTGQALVTARVVHHQPGVTWSEYVYRGMGWAMVSTWTGSAFRLWRDMALGRIKTLYLVCSRSNGGFFRDIPALLVSRLGVRVIIHAHGSDIVDLLSARFFSAFVRVLYSRCDIIVPSAHLLTPLRERTGARLHLCENYFAGDDAVRSTSLPLDATEIRVLWNSNVMASKGFFDTVQAVQQLRAEGLPIRLIALGRPLGDKEMSRKETARNLYGLEARGCLEYVGQLDQARVISLMANTDAICLPSRYSSECQPLAVIQAMCMGKSIIVSDIPAMRATLGEYPAFFVPVRSSIAIADALRKLMYQKRADPAAFGSSRREAAAVAKKRFGVTRFDREMATILRSKEALYNKD